MVTLNFYLHDSLVHSVKNGAVPLPGLGGKVVLEVAGEETEGYVEDIAFKYLDQDLEIMIMLEQEDDDDYDYSDTFPVPDPPYYIEPLPQPSVQEVAIITMD